MGDAVFFDDRSDQIAQDAGFYAVAYDLNGSKVISFRGTDNLNSIDPTTDIFNGWQIGVGFANAPQAQLAIDFYEAITQQSAFAGPSANTILTGHSLGGGLAGLLSSLTQTQAVGFDHMPFSAAAIAAYIHRVDQGLPVFGDPSPGAFRGFSTEGEFLEFVRNGSAQIIGGGVLGSLLGLVNGPLGGLLAGLGVISGTTTATLEAAVDNTKLLNFGAGGLFDAISLHSASFLTWLMYAKQNEGQLADWQALMPELSNRFFDNSFAVKVGVTPELVGGTAAASVKLTSLIAYSALEAGTLPYGNSAIRALFDDLNDIGKAIDAGNEIDAFKQSLVDTVLQFAGELALNADQATARRQGVVSLAQDLSTLAVDVSTPTWTIGSAAPNEIIGREELFDDLDVSGTLSGASRSAFDALYGPQGEDRLGRLIFRLTDDGSAVQLPSSGSGDPISFYAGVKGNDTVTGSALEDEVIYGGDGNDVLDGGGGVDLLIGGRGDDQLVFSSDNGAAIGGDGKDAVVLPNVVSGTASGVVIADILVRADGGLDFDVAAASGATANYKLYEVETLVATDSADVLIVSDGARDAKTVVDLATNGTGRDLVDYSGLTHGVNFFDGHVSDRQGTVNRSGLTQLSSFGEELATVVDSKLRDATGFGFITDALVVSGAEHIILTDHNDSFIGATTTPGEGALLLETGGGADKVWWTANLGVTDLGFNDRVALFGAISLFGGGRSVFSESEYAKGLGGLVEYGVNDSGELAIHLEWMADGYEDMFVLNWQDSKINDFTGAGGITLFEHETRGGNFLTIDRSGGLTRQGTWDRFGLLLKTTFGPENGIGGSDPLILDLDGDGYELTNQTSASPRFDIDNDLYLERTAFAEGDDGVLARDINNDGAINDASEIFGFARNSGFSVLATLDGNGDGKVDASDDGLAGVL